MNLQPNRKYNTKPASLVTETIAAVMAPILDTSNASYVAANYGVDAAAPTAIALPYWSSDGGGDGGGSGSDTSQWGNSAAAVSGSYNELIATVGSTHVYNDTQVLDHNSSDYYEYPPPCLSFDESANVSYWNVTCDNALEYGLPLYGYCMPFLLVITVAANSLIVLVLSKKHLATPTNLVLRGKCLESFFSFRKDGLGFK